MGRSYKTDAVVLRSIRFSEADRILHLFTLERGRVNAIAKGVRKTSSRFGARLEPLTHASLMLHEGRGAVGQIAAEAVLKLFVEPEPAPRAFAGLCRFLDLLDQRTVSGDPTL